MNEVLAERRSAERRLPGGRYAGFQPAVEFGSLEGLRSAATRERI